MKWYNDGNNDIWFFGGCHDPSKFVSQRKERHILRIIIDFCYRKGWDPFIVFNYYCASDMAQLISDGCASGYFYDESKLLNEAADLGLLKPRDNDWDIIIFHWIIDIYITARFDLSMPYLDIARKYPAEEVYKKFSPLHETSESNALSKMVFNPSDLFCCIINAKVYLFKHDIPEDLQYLLDKEKQAKFRKGLIIMRTVFFHKVDEPNGYLSNFYPSEFCLDGNVFSCAEQFLMWSKAKLFKDDVTAEMILQEADPDKIKALGRSVKGYNDSYWAAERYEVMKKGLTAKFKQNKELKKKLLASSGQFAECAKNDLVWGIGLAMDDPGRIDQTQWKGRNLLGFALRDVYNELKQGNP